MTETVYGSKYKSGRDVKEIAKLVRTDIRAAVAAGELPKAKYAVNISRFAGGCSLRVSVNEIAVPILNEERARLDWSEPHVHHSDVLDPRYTASGSAATRRMYSV